MVEAGTSIISDFDGDRDIGINRHAALNNFRTIFWRVAKIKKIKISRASKKHNLRKKEKETRKSTSCGSKTQQKGTIDRRREDMTVPPTRLPRAVRYRPFTLMRFSPRHRHPPPDPMANATCTLPIQERERRGKDRDAFLDHSCLATPS